MEAAKGAIIISDEAAWEQLPGEPAHYHLWFEVYRGLGLRRTVRQTHDAIGEPEVTEGRLRELAKRWKWVERARLWDAEEAKLDRDALQRLRENDIKRINAETVQHADSVLSIVAQVHAEALRRIQHNELRFFTPNQIIMLLEWATKAGSTADKMRRVALGIPTELTRHERHSTSVTLDLTPKQYDGLDLSAFPQPEGNLPALPDPNVIEGHYTELAAGVSPIAPATPPAYWAETAEAPTSQGQERPA